MTQDPQKPPKRPFNLMLLIVGLLVLLTSGGCTLPFLGLTLWSIWLHGFDFGDLSGASGALAGLFLFIMLIGIGVMALGAWLVYLALPRRR